MGRVIEKYIQKRETNDGTYLKKEPTCTKTDLNALMDRLTDMRISLHRVRAYEDGQRAQSLPVPRPVVIPRRPSTGAFRLSHVADDAQHRVSYHLPRCAANFSEIIEEVPLAEAISVAMRPCAACDDDAPDEEASDLAQRGATLCALSVLPSEPQEQAARLQLKLFTSSTGFTGAKLNAELNVIGVLTATALANPEQMKSVSINSPYIQRVSAAAASEGSGFTTLFVREVITAGAELTRIHTRSTATEAGVCTVPPQQSEHAKMASYDSRTFEHDLPDDAPVKALPQKPKHPPPPSAWFEFWTTEARILSTGGSAKCMRAFELRAMVACLQLSLTEGYHLYESDPAYRGTVFELGSKAEQRLIAFLSKHDVKAKSVGTVHSAMRRLESDGKLDELKASRTVLVASGAIYDLAMTGREIAEQI
ncbi:hypothetical protein PybrP1_005140 [[Pythium] brassicae (nom. inval.)]|nr:hypothetical protein PybrP1_005140 [[Pythium] brassicae (nom. inval.)]